MSDLSLPDRSFCVLSLLFNRYKISDDVLIDLIKDKFGDGLFFYHNFCPMKEYYSNELGTSEHLDRFIFVSMSLFERSHLVDLKMWADSFEKKYLDLHGNRIFNLDVGMLAAENLILASGKKYSHRIYLDRGVYAELALQFQDNSFHTLPWTYPDYAHLEFISFFNFVRRALLRKK